MIPDFSPNLRVTLGNSLILSKFSFFVHKVRIILVLAQEDLIRRVLRSLAVVSTVHWMSSDVRSGRKLQGHLGAEGAAAHRGSLTWLGQTGNVCFLSTPPHDVFQRPERVCSLIPRIQRGLPTLDLQSSDLGFWKVECAGVSTPTSHLRSGGHVFMSGPPPAGGRAAHR